MKKVIWSVLAVVFVAACQDNETSKSDFTGREVTYALFAGAEYDIDGTATIQEKNDGTAFVSIILSGTEGDLEHPVHIHLGNLSEPGAAVFANLNPVLSKTGKSETHLTQLADESSITYQQLIDLYACVKIHLSASGPSKDIILAAGNVGSASDDDTSTGRLGFGSCKSE